MKTIAQFVAGGITTLADLQNALQTAMQLEFATTPPYLCAEWSINADPSNVAGTIGDIVKRQIGIGLLGAAAAHSNDPLPQQFSKLRAADRIRTKINISGAVLRIRYLDDHERSEIAPR